MATAVYSLQGTGVCSVRAMAKVRPRTSGKVGQGARDVEQDSLGVRAYGEYRQVSKWHPQFLEGSSSVS